jgi:hypothetical protein
MAAEFILEKFPVGWVVSRFIAKKWIRQTKQFVSGRKYMTEAASWWRGMKNSRWIPDTKVCNLKI